MSVEKINTAELETEKRFHVNQADVPGKSAQEMKEFMDYIPRQVIIPKVNELVDTANASALASDVYTKTETEEKLSKKANAADVYDKSQVYTKSEVLDRTQDKATIAYVNTEFAKKANASDVYAKSDTYQKTETDALLSSKLSTDSDRIIQDVETQPQGNGTLLCREGGELKLYESKTEAPAQGDAAEKYLSPVKCTYATETELVSAIEVHGLTDETPQSSPRACILMFDLYTPDDTFVDTVCIYNTLGNYYIGSGTGLLTVRSGVTAANWANGTGDLYAKYTAKGYTGLVLKNISDFAAQSMSELSVSYSPFATREDVEKRLEKSNPDFEGTLKTSRTDVKDASNLISFNIQTSSGEKTFTVSPVILNGQVARVEIGGTIPIVFGSTVKGAIYSHDAVLSDSNGHTGDATSHLIFNDDVLGEILNSSAAPAVIEIDVDSEFFGDSSKSREFVMTRQFDGLYIQNCLYNRTMYRVILNPQSLEMWYEQM